MDSHPEFKYIYRHVIEGVCAGGSSKWLNLGTELLNEEDVPALQAIEASKDDHIVCCTKMFKLWLERQPKASWRHLIKALEKIHLNKLASDMERLLVDQVNKEIATKHAEISQRVSQDDQLAVEQSLLQENCSGTTGMYRVIFNTSHVLIG